jgi:hypothetical protein
VSNLDKRVQTSRRGDPAPSSRSGAAGYLFEIPALHFLSALPQPAQKF